MDVSATADHTFTVPATPAQAFALVSDVPDSVAHFPGLDAFEAAGPDTWRWRLQKLGSGKLSLQTVYTCRYTSDPAARTVRWVALGADGDNARVVGSWSIGDDPAGARLRLVNTLSVTVPVPRLMRRPAQALVRRENSRLIQAYIENLERTFAGGDGRIR